MTTTNQDQEPDDFLPDSPDETAGYSVTGAEPTVDVPAGLLGQAIELLDLCDELFNRPGHTLLDDRISAVIDRNQRANAAVLRRFHDKSGRYRDRTAGTPPRPRHHRRPHHPSPIKHRPPMTPAHRAPGQVLNRPPQPERGAFRQFQYPTAPVHVPAEHVDRAWAAANQRTQTRLGDLKG